MDILDFTAAELGRKIKEKEVSVREAVQASLNRIAGTDQELNCFVTVDEQGAYEQAEKIQKLIDQAIANSKG